MNDDLDPAPRAAADAPAPARDTSPPAGVSERPYRCATARYWPHLHDPRAGKRYAGHHAEILQEQGTLARVAVYPPGKSQQPGVRPVTMWIDLASPEQCDAGPGSLTTIRTGGRAKTRRALPHQRPAPGPALTTTRNDLSPQPRSHDDQQPRTCRTRR